MWGSPGSEYLAIHEEIQFFDEKGDLFILYMQLTWARNLMQKGQISEQIY